MTFLIKKKNSSEFIRSEIDSGGMSVFWSMMKYADRFPTMDEAESFMQRCQERYPDEGFEIFGYSDEERSTK